MSLSELQDEVAGSKKATLDEILPALTDAALGRVAKALGLPADDARETLVGRISKTAGEPSTPAPPAPSPLPAPAPAAMFRASAEPSSAVEPPPPPTTTAPALAAGDLRLAIHVEPRKPRLAWQGMDRRERVVSVPTQVVEVVSPGRAVDRGDSLLDTGGRTETARAGDAEPPNRLIWTNDNIVALQTLLDERDPTTQGLPVPGQGRPRLHRPAVHGEQRLPGGQRDRHRHRRRGGRAGEEGAVAGRDPRVQGYVEAGARQLSHDAAEAAGAAEGAARADGSIYVHLDWHAVHYVKVMMDELFGYENFQNEIVWKRTVSHNDLDTYGNQSIHDTILVVSA